MHDYFCQLQANRKLYFSTVVFLTFSCRYIYLFGKQTTKKMSGKTAHDISKWMNAQSRPAPAKRVLLVVRPTASDALKEFTLQYNRLLREKINSRTAFALYSAVIRAETAKDLVARIPANVRHTDSIQDCLSGLQLSMYAAANWIRRFADDRHTIGEWVMLEEKRAGKELAEQLEFQVKDLFSRVAARTNSKTIQTAFEAFVIKWNKQEESQLKLAEVENQKNVENLRKEFAKVEKEASSAVSLQKKFVLTAYCAELEDSRKELTKEQHEFVTAVKGWLHHADEAPPPWRTDGIKTLGPFGIAAAINISMNFEFPENHMEQKLGATFIVDGPKEAIKVYEAGLGGTVKGSLSPVFKITIKKEDPTAALIRIPLNAAYFAFVYPVITGQLEVQIEQKSYLDAFLLYGGFVYFDSEMKLIQANSLWVGCQMQLSAPKALPSSVSEKLKAGGRFHDITLPQLIDVGAKQFAWILPGEFHPEIKAPHGGWAYLYENDQVNNYFSIASAESVLGLAKAFSLHDLPKN